MHCCSFTDVHCIVLHSFSLVLCLIHFLCDSCLCDVLILTCFLFNSRLTDAGFVNVCNYKSFTVTEQTPVPNMGNKPFSSCLQNL